MPRPPTLTESETEAIHALRQIKGKALDETFHEAIEQFFDQHPSRIVQRICNKDSASGATATICAISPN